MNRCAHALYYALACFALPLACMAAAGQDDESTEAPAPPWYHGSLDATLTLERSDRDSNVWMDQVLRLELSPPRHPRITLKGGVWMIEDLDGHEDRTSALRNLHDTFGASVQVRLLHLFVEIEDPLPGSVLRIGRQRILDSPAFNRIDGAYFRKNEGRWQWYAFGGARASLYQDAHDDLTLGGGAGVDLTRKLRIAFDAFYGEDERRRGEEVFRGPLAGVFGLAFPRRVKRDTDSRMASVSASYRLAPNHSLYGRYTWFDGESDEMLVTATGVFLPREIVYDVTYRRRENILGDRANELTGFYRILGEQNNFDELTAVIHVPFAERYTLSLEGQVHDAERESTATANRDYYRLSAILGVEELFRGMDASLGVEKWTVEGEEGSWIVTGGIVKSWEQWKLTVGADYERFEDRITEYRSGVLPATRLLGRIFPPVGRFFNVIAAAFDTDVVETHENIYSAYARADFTLRDNQTIRVGLSYEQDDGPDSPYWELEARYSIKF